MNDDTHYTDHAPIDFIEIDARAREARARALADGVAALRRWLTGRSAPDGRAA